MSTCKNSNDVIVGCYCLFWKDTQSEYFRICSLSYLCFWNVSFNKVDV